MTATAAGVDRAVLVQAHGAYGSDNAYVLDALRVAPERWVGVVIVDPTDPDPASAPPRARYGTGVRGRAPLRHRSHRADLVRRRRRSGALGRGRRPRPPHRGNAAHARAAAPRRDAGATPGSTGGARPLRFPRPARESVVPGPGAIARALRAPRSASQGDVARARGCGCGGGCVRRTAAWRRSAPTGWCGGPTTRRPTTAPTPNWWRWDATRARVSTLPTRRAVLGKTALGLWPSLAVLTLCCSRAQVGAA